MPMEANSRINMIAILCPLGYGMAFLMSKNLRNHIMKGKIL